MEADCGAGKSHRRGFLTTRSLREAWPEGAYDGTKQPHSGSGIGELFDRRHGEETQESFLSGFELGEHETSRRRSAWPSGH